MRREAVRGLEAEQKGADGEVAGEGQGGPGVSRLAAVPALEALRCYSLRCLRCDTAAGLTVAAVAVPQAMAYAQIAGVGPEFGLYTAMVTTAAAALFNSSRHLINGPTNAISIAVFSALAAVPEEQKAVMAALLALLVGLVQLGITLFRLGDLTRYISHAVLVGFTLAAGTLIMLGQLQTVLGLVPQGTPHDYFLSRVSRTLSTAGEFNPWTLSLGVGTVAIILALRLVNRRWGLRLPELLIAVLAAAVAVAVFDLEAKGVAVVGAIPRKLPSGTLPPVQWQAVRQLAGSAMVIALLGLLESLAMAKVLAARSGQRLDINQQCFSEGMANLAGSLFQCFPGSGSFTRSSINAQAGAMTQWSGFISAVAVGATVLLFAPLARYVPRAALAGILMVAAVRMIDRHRLLFNLRATRFDRGIVVVTALSGVFISIEFCILIGTFLSFVFYVPRAARVNLTELTWTPDRVIRERLPGDRPCERILLFSLEGELFFGSAPDVDEHLATIESRAQPGIRVVVLRVKRARNPDAVCLELIDEFLRRMEARGVTVLFCGVRHDMARVLANVGMADRLGPNRIFREVPAVWSSTLEAMRHAYELLGDDLCPHCPRRRRQEPGTWYYMI